MQSLKRLKPLLGFGWYVLTIVLYAALWFAVWSSPLWDILARIGWWMTVNRSLPFFFQFDHFNIDSSVELMRLPGLLLMVAIALFIWHAAIVLAIVVIHRLWGRPSYLTSIRSSFGRLLAQQSSSVWWIWLFTIGISIIAEPITSVLNRCWVEWAAGIASWIPLLGFTLLSGMSASSQLRRQILQQVDSDDLRCAKCNYLLLGLEATRCPECGEPIPDDRAPRYRIPWHRMHTVERSSVSWMLVRIMGIMLVLAVLTSINNRPPSNLRAWAQNSWLTTSPLKKLLPRSWFYFQPIFPISYYHAEAGTVIIQESPEKVVAIHLIWSQRSKQTAAIGVWQPDAFASQGPPEELVMYERDQFPTRMNTWNQSEHGFQYLSLASPSENPTIVLNFPKNHYVWGFRLHEAPKNMSHVAKVFIELSTKEADLVPAASNREPPSE